MKLNWGTGIFLTFVIFVAVTLAMVYVFMNQDVNLVTDDYYQKELEYQNHIETIKRTNKLPEKLEIKTNRNAIVIKFPTLFHQKSITGNIFFYRPSDRKRDMTFPIVLNDNNEQIISTSPLIKGLWKVQVEWKNNDSAYFNEKEIMVN